MTTPSTIAADRWMIAATSSIEGDRDRTAIGTLAAAPAYIRGSVIFAVGTVFGLFAAGASWTFTAVTGTALWTGQADPSTDWRYVIAMNVSYWNTWALLTPAILAFSERFTFNRESWRRALPWHLAGGLLFVAAHSAMVGTSRTFLQRLFGMHPDWWSTVVEAYLRTLDWELTFYWAIVGLSHAIIYYRYYRAAQTVVVSRETETRRIFVRTDGGFVLLRVDEIDWIEAAGNYACLHAGSDTHVIRDSLKNLESRLARVGFVRINRPTIVNVERVKAIETGVGREPTVVLRDGTRLPAARHSEHKLRALFERE